MKNLTFGFLSPLAEPFFWLKGSLIFLIGPIDLQLAYLLLAIAVDLVFGIQIAVKEHTFKWSILVRKLRQKLTVYILWIAMFHAFDMVTGLPNSARWAVVAMLAGLEIISAIKNTARLGHSKLADALEGLYLALTRNQPHQVNEDEHHKYQDAEKGGTGSNEKGQP